MKRVSPILFIAFLLLLLFVVVNLTTSWIFGSFLIDATSNQRYTLNKQTHSIVKNLPQKVKLRLYLSNDLSGYDWNIAAYAAEVVSFLSRYQQLQPNKINLQIYRIENGGEKEKQALNNGILPLSTDDQNYYFGLSILADDGRNFIIPNFLPERRQLLETDLSRLLADLAMPEKLKVGIFSPNLPLSGDKTPFNAFLSLLSQNYDLLQISPKDFYIPQNIDVLILINPSRLETLFAYAVDQYLMRGGKVIFLIDPYSELRHKQQGYPPKPDTHMEEFLKTWGIKYNSRKITGDEINGEKIRDNNGQTKTYPLWFWTKDNQGKKLHFYTPGSLEINNYPDLTYELLVSTLDKSGEIGVEKVRYAPKTKIIQNYVQDNNQRILALLVQGEFRSHFRGNPLEGTQSVNKIAPFLPWSSKDAAVVVIADSDWIGDNSWVASFNQLNPVFGTNIYADNAYFLLNLIDRLGKRQQIPFPNNHLYGAKTNIAQVFYLKSFQAYEKQREKLEDQEKLSAAVLYNLKQLNDNNNLHYQQEIQQAQAQNQRDQQALKAVNRQIEYDTNNYLKHFILFNVLIFPLLIFLFIILLVFILRKLFLLKVAK